MTANDYHEIEPFTINYRGQTWEIFGEYLNHGHPVQYCGRMEKNGIECYMDFLPSEVGRLRKGA